MQLRALLKGHNIEFTDSYNGHREIFTVWDVEKDSQVTIIKGITPFQRIFVPNSAIQPLLEQKRCTYFRQYDTQIMEYKVRLCIDI